MISALSWKNLSGCQLLCTVALGWRLGRPREAGSCAKKIPRFGWIPPLASGSRWLFSLTLLSLVTGCTLPKISSLPSWGKTASADSAQASPAATLAEQTSGAQPQRNLLSKLADSLTPGSPGEQPNRPHASQVHAAYQEIDPIALNYKSAPPSVGLYLAVAQLSDRRGDVPQARAMYRRALQMEAENRDALLGLARLEDRAGNLKQAIQIYRRGAAAHPEDASMLNDMALCLARQGQLHPAAQTLQQAIQLQPQKQLHRNNLAKVLVELNHLDAAVAHLQAVHPPAVARYNAGVLLHQRQRHREAARHLAAAVELDPELQIAGKLLAQIQPASVPGQPQGAYADQRVLPTPPAAFQQVAGQAPQAASPLEAGQPPAVPARTARASQNPSLRQLPRLH